MKAVCGTGKQEFGSMNIILYAFINIEALFKIIPSIDIYITGNGRIVTKCSIPASLVTKVRKNDAEGTEIRNPMQAPNPPAPAGPPRVRSRDSTGGSPAPKGSNYTDPPLPDRKTATKAGKELEWAYEHAPSRDRGYVIPGSSIDSCRCSRKRSKRLSATTRLVAEVVVLFSTQHRQPGGYRE